MSIASNVVEENSRLATARTLLREKLTANNIAYDDSDTIFELLKRYAYSTFQGNYSIFYPSESEVKEGSTLSAGVDIWDSEGDPVEGVPCKVIINETSYKVYSDSNGKAEKTFTAGEEGTTLTVSVIAGSSTIEETYTIKSALEFTDEDEQDTDLYEVIKYPTSMNHTFSTYNWDSGYNQYGYLLSKAITSSTVVMLIPKGISAFDSSKTGIHFKADIVQKKNSNSGWADAIALVSSKTLSHYRDTKILELGAYNSNKGVKYSGTNHVVNSISTTTGQLALDSTWYTLEMYYDNGYLKATIMNGSTQVFSYEGDVSSKISFDTFYPAIMIYEYGGAMLFNNVTIEPWESE